MFAGVKGRLRQQPGLDTRSTREGKYIKVSPTFTVDFSFWGKTIWGRDISYMQKVCDRMITGLRFKYTVQGFQGNHRERGGTRTRGKDTVELELNVLLAVSVDSLVAC